MFSAHTTTAFYSGNNFMVLIVCDIFNFGYFQKKFRMLNLWILRLENVRIYLN
jgi:hypothetical protein